ncbi:MAG TPA: hypothetical protein VLH84_02160 [Patescibacteria group bacterium]|nr:hypothetical protein [Candidatus Saccharimonadales bacterium]HSX35715.1 hypothetical protein [Patescibacteria group bacterium]
MIDAMMCRQADRAGYTVDPSYSPGHVIRGIQIVNPDAERLSVVFPPWHGGGVYGNVLASRIANHRDPDGSQSAVWTYDFADDIIHPSVDGVLAGYRTIRDRVARDLDSAVGPGRLYRSVDIYSVSLGTVAASVVASAYPNFRAATMVVPGSSLAHCLWEGVRTQALRAALVANHAGLDVDALHDAWRELTTLHSITSFAGKAALVVRSWSDNIIPRDYQTQVMAQLVAAGARVESPRATSFGHYATAANYCLRGTVGHA